MNNYNDPTGVPPPAFPTDLPPRTGSQQYQNRNFKSRYCGSARSCFGYTFSAWSLKVTGLNLFRRICMYLLWLTQLALATLNGFVFDDNFGAWIVKLIFLALFSILTFWSLSVIDGVKGEKRIKGVAVSRRGLTYFVFACTVIYAALMAGWFFEDFPKTSEHAFWFLTAIAIAAAAGVATTVPEPSPYSV
ncbi:hypothetical protein LTR78_004584 [Recurvomyces mirabilis]|uniref:Uncharacterized protein n=1 Tax=Recurvomyces mirabilis TaxID=574656 RepID=A0AAE1C2A8_9PEZI|nr:hypothetical protein LTR78_004584 [Recurvomyces mirabilis]KAK5152922.1 hypothetical protein LTS14_008030 [Recurvomyces mirabilis]